ncbi:hypothetical protein ER308_12000 [Egibacter rhizosphaerae]|uniref:DUF2269 family protein n=1 Tax=Egibacter rhizosphaerae TaxID=1670831 RepID=A0A411YGD0_9ACTN|nr:hypothetical protein [Egibacter rhizosphaerae]QBI20217.1 hypothetical protein ER308_12000 [Egibacter rhizosphaerae]
MMAGRTTRLLLIVHVAVAAGLVGAALTLIVLGVAGVRGADPRMVYPAAHLVDAWVVAPLGLVALISGIIQARVTGRSLLHTRWVRAKLLITAGMTAVVIFVLEPRLAASARDALADQAFVSTDFLPLAAAPVVALALVLVNVTLGMNARDGRTRPSRSASSPASEATREA